MNLPLHIYMCLILDNFYFATFLKYGVFVEFNRFFFNLLFFSTCSLLVYLYTACLFEIIDQSAIVYTSLVLSYFIRG